MKDSSVGVIILNYGLYQHLMYAMQSVAKSKGVKKIEVLVVDLEPNLNELRVVKEKFPRAKFLTVKANIGCGAGYNYGIDYLLKDCLTGAKKKVREKKRTDIPDYIFLMNSDAKVEVTTIEVLTKTMSSDPMLGLLSPKILQTNPSSTIYFTGGIIDPIRFSGGHRGYNEYDRGQYDATTATDFVTMAAVLVRSEVFFHVGKIEDSFFLYYEDTDFSLRARKSGYRLEVETSSLVWHDSSAAVNRSAIPLKDYYLARNVILFYRRHAPFFKRIRATLFSLKEAIEQIIGLMFDKSNRNKHYYMFRGIIDGLLGRSGKARLPTIL